MGLGISFESKQRLFSSIKPDDLERVLSQLKVKLGLRGICKQEDGYYITVCPVGDFRLHFQKGRLAGEIKTTVAGPGYHKACVEFIDALGVMLNIKWNVDDETGYFFRRYFFEMKSQMLTWLNSMFTHLVIKNKGKNDVQFICWELGSYLPILDNNIISPCGLLVRESIQRLIERNQIEQLARQFWVWCNEGYDAYFYRGCALAMMWCDIPWRKPATNREEAVLLDTLDCLEHASKLDRSIPLPNKEWRELCELAGKPDLVSQNPPLEFPIQIGYRRNVVRYNFPCDYWICLPGTFLEEYDENATVLHDGDKVFRITVFTVKDQMQQDIKDTMRISFDSFPFGSQQIDVVKNDYRYLAQFGKTREDDSEYYILFGQVGGKDKLAMVTISWRDEADEGWAVDMFQSIQVEQ